MRRVLVIGGYGGFGAKITRLAARDGFHIIVAGRNLAKAEAFCVESSKGRFEALALDRETLTAAGIAETGAWAVVDAAGPWQGNDYCLPRACIDAGCHYLDIADARAFVTGIDALDCEARAADVAIIAGASTAPALTSAVCDALSTDLDRITKVEMRLSASNRATGSASITRAVLSYAGKPIALWRGGRWRSGFGLLDIERVAFDEDGRRYRRLVGLCDVPDHDLIPARYPGRPATVFRAGTEVALQNRAIWLTGWLVRLGLLGDGRWMERPALLAQRLMRGIGGARSAMRIDLAGWRGGMAVKKRWDLLAESGDGPWVPALAVPALLRRLHDGEIDAGARPASGLVYLADYDAGFAGLAITHAIGEQSYRPLYERVMEEDFAKLTPAVHDMHRVVGEAYAEGAATIVRGRNPLLRLAGWMFGFPPAGTDVPLNIWMDENDGIETWHRDFGGHELRSHLSEYDGLIVERFGPMRFGFELRREADGLSMHLRRWWLGPLRLPLFLAPRSPAREYEENGLFHFDVPIRVPLMGLVIHYRGWLKPPPVA